MIKLTSEKKAVCGTSRCGALDAVHSGGFVEAM